MVDGTREHGTIPVVDQEDKALGAADKAVIQRAEVPPCQLPDSGT